jgi:hypothetical protein
VNLGSIPGISANLPLGVIGNTSRSEREESWFETKRGIQFFRGRLMVGLHPLKLHSVGSTPTPGSNLWAVGVMATYAPFKHGDRGFESPAAYQFASLVQWQNDRFLICKMSVRPRRDAPILRSWQLWLMHPPEERTNSVRSRDCAPLFKEQLWYFVQHAIKHSTLIKEGALMNGESILKKVKILNRA